jgi:hypothetical protein
VLRLALRIVRCRYGRALVAWCVVFALALTAAAQDAAFDKPPVGMDPDREAQFEDTQFQGLPDGEPVYDEQYSQPEYAEDGSILSSDQDGSEVMVDDGGVGGGFSDPGNGPMPNDVDYGPQVGARFGAPYEYTGEQGLPFIMQQEGGAYQPGSFYNPDEMPPPPKTYCRCMSWFGFRHSYTHGRSVGWGLPLVGSSWLNRPYYFGATLGPMWLTNRPIPSVPRDVDVVGSLIFGWDWDYYWGSEFQYAYATPELGNPSAPPGSPIGHRYAHWNYSFIYYPWGDSNLRPYWRLGAGNTHYDYTLPNGVRWNEWTYSTPFGVGLKYSFRRWLAGRIEFTDQFSWGDHGTATQHNLTLNFGLEMRFGAKRKAYWPWNPSRHVW